MQLKTRGAEPDVAESQKPCIAYNNIIMTSSFNFKLYVSRSCWSCHVIEASYSTDKRI